MATSPATALGPGTRLGDRYLLERRIGGGGMATVWLATDSELRRAVAVKVLSDVLAAEAGYRARFRREAKLAARLSHASLVRVFDCGEEGERPYLVMEYVAGPTLAARIASGDRIQADRLARELLGALAHIHRAGIVHRDVKPANVLFDSAGRAKLTDFGIARPDDATRITQTGEVIGTLRYMAPEVVAGDPATPRSDLYAAGVLLAEATSAGGGPVLDGLIASLRAADRAQRPESAEAALARLDETPTAPTTPIPRRRREVEIPLLAVLGLLAAVAAVVIAIALIAGGGGGGGAHRSAGHAHTGAATSAPATTQPAGTPAPAKPPTGSKTKPPKEAKPPKPAPAKPKEIPPGRAKHGLGPPPGHAGEKGD
jgi:serine/threonine protein kinase